MKTRKAALLIILILATIASSCRTKKEVTRTQTTEKQKQEMVEETDTREETKIKIDSTSDEVREIIVIKYDTAKQDGSTFGKQRIREVVIYKNNKTTKKAETRQTEKTETESREAKAAVTKKSDEKTKAITRNQPGTKTIIIATILLALGAFLLYIFKRPGSRIALIIVKAAARVLGLIAGLFKAK